MPNVCRRCGSSDLEKDPDRYHVVCTKCGDVLEESAIVSSVQFEEGDGGGRVIGQFVSTDGTSSTHLTGFGGMYYGESRTATLQNGKRHIEDLAGKLRLSQHFVDIAYNFYKLAVVRRLTRGHRLTHIIAACLYLACRLESTQHMLLDFSDALQADVYALGHAYLYITAKLAINPPAMDPCIYVSRFAHRLELGEKTHEVSITALRLVSRMKKDWIHTGRRPSGLCGAALLIAARIHGFNRGVDDIIRVVKVCQATVMKRLLEFANTESSNLTVEEFNRVDLEQEEDPPAFSRSKAEQEAKQSGLLGAGEVDLEKYEADLVAVHKEIERVLNETEVKRRRYMYRKFGLREEGDFDKIVDQCEVELGGNNTEDISKPEKDTPPMAKLAATTGGSVAASLAEVDDGEDLDDTVAFIEQDIDKILQQEGGAYKLRPTLASLGLASADNQPPAETNDNTKNKSTQGSPSKQVQNSQNNKPDRVDEDDDIDSLPDDCELDVSGIDDGEIEGYLLKPAEVKVRTILWTKLNAEYLKEAAEKAARLREEEEERAKSGGAGDAGGADSKAKQAKRRRSRKIQPQATPGQAIEVLVQRKKLSSKIDYDKLRSLLPGGTAAAAAMPTALETAETTQPIEDSAKGNDNNNTEAVVSKRAAAPTTGDAVSEKVAKTSLLSRLAASDVEEEDDEEEEYESDTDVTSQKNPVDGGSATMSAAHLLAQWSGGSYSATGEDYDS